MPAPFRRSLFQITDEEPLETYPPEDTSLPAEEQGREPGAAEDGPAVESQHAAHAPVKRIFPLLSSPPGSKVAYTGAIVALAIGLVATLHVMRGVGESERTAGDRPGIPSVAPRIGRAQPAPPRTLGERPPRRVRHRASRPAGDADARPSRQIDPAPAATRAQRVAPPAPPTFLAPTGRSVASVARAPGEEFGIER